jgi:EmrB/QacA subfamily drug resistance transporter
MILARLPSEHPRPAWVRDWSHGWWLAVGTVCFGAFMGQLDASITVLTYPALAIRFGATSAAVEWVSLSYLVTLTALLVPSGRFSDAYGRKLLYLCGFLVFTLASAACGLAPGLGALIAFRAVQAIGAALLQANSVALVATSAPRHRLRAALGVQAGAQALGLALGPTLGGVIVTQLGWRWVFLVNVPVGVAALVAGRYFLPRTRERTALDRVDRLGLLLLVMVSTATLLAISAASGLGLPAAAVLVLFGLAAACGAGFARRLTRSAFPLVDPAMLRDRGMILGLVGALGGYLVLFGPLVLVPAVLTAAGTPLVTAGTAATALPAGFALAAVAADRALPARWDDRRRAMAGAALAFAALVAMLPVPQRVLYLVPPLAVLGFGLGVFAPANNAQLMAAVPVGAEGTGGSLLSMSRALGTALGVALVTLGLDQARHFHQPTHAGVLAVAVLALAAAGVLAATWAAGRPTATAPTGRASSLSGAGGRVRDGV